MQLLGEERNQKEGRKEEERRLWLMICVDLDVWQCLVVFGLWAGKASSNLWGRTWKIEVKAKIKVELCTFYSAEVTALHSGLVSHHCR